MGKKLFGLDIAKLVNDNITKAGGLESLTLTKYTSGTATVGALTEGTNDSPSSSTGQGIIETISEKEDGLLLRGTGRRPKTLVEGATAIVTILGGSLPDGVIPEANDQVTIDGATYEILTAEADPAQASFECQVAG